MPSRNEFISAVDAFFAMPAKSIIAPMGDVIWQPGRSEGEQRAVFPIEVNGEQHGQTLVIQANPYAATLTFSIMIAFPPVVCRLDYNDTVRHMNNLQDYVEGTNVLIVGSHFHRWALNSRFVASDGALPKLPHAENIPRMNSFKSAFRWFCDETGLAIPFDLDPDLPRRERLL